MPYLLDANVFISAKNLHYGFDFCPGFWDWLHRENGNGKVLTTEKVRDELLYGDDRLAEWIRQRPPSFFVAPDAETIPNLTRVSEWVRSQGNYLPAAISDFYQAADYYLVAQALSLGYSVVTHEIHDGSRKRVKIPTVCLGLDIPCLTPFELLRRERARFVLPHEQT